MATYGSTVTTSSGGNVNMNIAAGYGSVSRSGNTVTVVLYGKMWPTGSWSSNQYAVWIPSGGTKVQIKASGIQGSGTWESGGTSYSFNVNPADTSYFITLGFGWNATNSSEGAWAGVTVPFPAGITYTLSYNANGGTGAPGNQSAYAGGSVTISSTRPTRGAETASGYVVTQNPNGGYLPYGATSTAQDIITYSFSSWNTNSAGTGTNYNPGGSITLNSNVTLYAKWTSSRTRGEVWTWDAVRDPSSTSCTVSFNANGGSCSTTSMTSTATVFYSCNGWWTSATGGTRRCYMNGYYTPTSSETLYAHWDTNTGPYNEIMLPTPTRSGYAFNGWATSSTATSGVKGKYRPTGTTTLYATWVPEESGVLHYKQNEEWIHGVLFYKENGVWKRTRGTYAKESNAWSQGRNSIKHSELASYTHSQLGNYIQERVERGCL